MDAMFVLLVIVLGISAFLLWKRHQEKQSAQHREFATPIGEREALDRSEVRAFASPDMPSYDAWETGMLLGTDGELHVQVNAEITYIDNDQQRSRRRIPTRTLVPWNGDFAILAHCHARQAHRTFITSRIQEFVDLSSGELIDNVVGHLKSIYYAPPAGQVAGVFDRQRAEIDILLFVARANGHLSPKERALLISYLKETNTEISSSDEVWIAAIPPGAPSVREFKSAIRVTGTLEAARKDLLASKIEAISNLVPNELTKAAATTALRDLRSQTSR